MENNLAKKHKERKNYGKVAIIFLMCAFLLLSLCVPFMPNTVQAAEGEPMYTVQYVADGGSGIQTDNNVYPSGATVTVMPQGGVGRAGATFIGWSTEPDSGGRLYYPGETFVITSNVVLYAAWKIDKFNLYYDANGGSGGPATEKGFLFDQQVTVSYGKPTRKGDQFLYWTTKPNGGGAVYAGGNTFTIHGDTTLYAQWRSGMTAEKIAQSNAAASASASREAASAAASRAASASASKAASQALSNAESNAVSAAGAVASNAASNATAAASASASKAASDAAVSASKAASDAAASASAEAAASASASKVESVVSENTTGTSSAVTSITNITVDGAENVAKTQAELLEMIKAENVPIFTIGGASIPLYNAGVAGTWSLFDLLVIIATMASSLVCLVGAVIGKKVIETTKHFLAVQILQVGVILVGPVLALVFLLCETESSLMVVFNNYSFLFILMLGLQIVFAVTLKGRKKNKNTKSEENIENDQEELEEELKEEEAVEKIIRNNIQKDRARNARIEREQITPRTPKNRDLLLNDDYKMVDLEEEDKKLKNRRKN